MFAKHLENREKEKVQQTPRMNRSDKVWTALQAGTQDEPIVYEGRFLPDKNGTLSKKFFYHMWRSGDKWYNMLCPKTHEFGNWCPVCNTVSMLYNGTPEDKKTARELRRKERFAANFYITEDPRDKNANDDNSKSAGKVKIYELPGKINEKLVAEEDEKEGLREAAWDPTENGHNFIIKVKTTKPDADKRTFPDYASSAFSRKATALGSDKEIKAIMDSTHSIDDHINSMKKDDKWIKDTLVSEGLFQLIQREWEKHHGVQEEPSTKSTTATKPKEEDVPDFTPSESGESETDLLKELDSLKY